MILIGLLLQSTPPGPPPDPAEPPIVVTATPEPPESIPLGSRIARPLQENGDRQIASDTGVAGLIPGSGMDPFAGQTRRVRVTECRAGAADLSPETVCRFGALDRALGAGDYGAARALLEGIGRRPDLTDDETYLVHWFGYAIAMADGGDARDRQAALEGMLATSAMPQAYRLPALRSLVAIALRLDDRQQAVLLLERVVARAPGDAQSRANLAAFYSQQGRNQEAVSLLREAISLRLAERGEVPHAWTAFVDAAE